MSAWCSPDFQLIQQRTIFLLEPLTDPARAWVAEHLRADVTRFGPAIVVEHRCIVDTLAGICTPRGGVGLAMTPKAADPTRYMLHVVTFSVVREPDFSGGCGSRSRAKLKDPAAVAELGRQIMRTTRENTSGR